jgi:hypothetical protein
MVSKLKSLYRVCGVFMCCMPDSVDNVWTGMSKGMRSMEILPRKGKVGRFVVELCTKLLSWQVVLSP